jgi:Xaa-Pro aminopeptidase
LHEIVRAAFELAAEHLRAGRALDEYGIQQFILAAFERDGLHTDAAPIVGVNGHAADPHFVPTPESAWPVRPGDFLLIDLWAKEKAADSVYGDITWCGVCAPLPPTASRRSGRMRGPRRRLRVRPSAIRPPRCAASRSTTPPVG